MKQCLCICCLLLFMGGFCFLGYGQAVSGSDTAVFNQLEQRRVTLKSRLQPWIHERDSLELRPALLVSERRRMTLLSHQIANVYEQILSADSAFIFQHLHSILSLKVLQERALIRPLLPLEVLKCGWEALDTTVQHTAEGQKFGFLLKKQIQSAPGRVAPGFILYRPDGRLLFSTALRKKRLLLIDFWASWCVPCRKELPLLEKLCKRYDEKLAVVALSLDRDTARYQQVVQQEIPQGWIHVLCPDSVRAAYYIPALPTKYLIDQKGMIIGRWRGAGVINLEQLADSIKKYQTAALSGG